MSLELRLLGVYCTRGSSTIRKLKVLYVDDVSDVLFSCVDAAVFIRIVLQYSTVQSKKL